MNVKKKQKTKRIKKTKKNHFIFFHSFENSLKSKTLVMCREVLSNF